jgi:DNA-binding NarL/FixJ family response regulator
VNQDKTKPRLNAKLSHRRSAPSRQERRRWKPAEIKILRKLYPTSANREIAKQLGRSLSAVIAQAFHLQLKKNPKRLATMGRENIAHRWGSFRKPGR